ncbi:MAG: ABC transporter permease [Deltaproteobacteria bacterium]|nr:ABC transporter permease [Deltaproteobacteria bacterium]MBW2153327.1 ABC transporter permease [Deltaproteobacteria bacterium]
MIRYIFTRLATLIPILLGVSILVFSMFHLVPGDVVDIMMGDESAGDPKAAEQLRIRMGLDKPIYVQYWKWLKNAARGDLGRSMTSGNQVIDDIMDRLPVNIELMLIAMGFVIVLGIPLGMLSAYKQFSVTDGVLRVATIMGYAIPNFWLATLVVLVGSLYFEWLPVLYYVPFKENPVENIKCMIIPGFVLGTTTLSYIVRMTRSSVLDSLRQDYVRTARAKGMTERVILYVHVLKNSLIPVVTVLGFQIGVLIGGLVLTEEVFVLPGLGRLILLAIEQRDFMIVTGSILFLSFAFVMINLVVDIIYAFLDPRITY